MRLGKICTNYEFPDCPNRSAQRNFSPARPPSADGARVHPSKRARAGPSDHGRPPPDCGLERQGRIGSTMRQPHVDDVVRLNQDIPELALQRGQVGVIRSTWFAPTVAYEVEFDKPGDSTRALLLERQVTIEDALFEQNVDRPMH
jgi:hypothetical protein